VLDRDEDGLIVLTADEQVRHAIGRVFELWRRLGSARQVVKELVAEVQRLPRRTVGQRPVRWKRASYGAVHDLLTNPNVRLIDSWTPWLRAQQLISSRGSLAHIDP
jgi:hypothetical protein